MAKVGEQWIESRERRTFELAVLGTLAPGLGITALAAAATARTIVDAPIIHEVERASYPGDKFTIKKLGDPASDHPLLRIFRQAMIDEIPQTRNVFRGSMSLIGPRPDTPTHIYELFEAIKDPTLRDEWQSVRAAQKPGIISSYALHSHRHNLRGATEASRFSETELRIQNAHLRAELDIADFYLASFHADRELLADAVRMAAANYHIYASALGRRMLSRG